MFWSFTFLANLIDFLEKMRTEFKMNAKHYYVVNDKHQNGGAVYDKHYFSHFFVVTFPSNSFHKTTIKTCFQLFKLQNCNFFKNKNIIVLPTNFSPISKQIPSHQKQLNFALYNMLLQHLPSTLSRRLSVLSFMPHTVL